MGVQLYVCFFSSAAFPSACWKLIGPCHAYAQDRKKQEEAKQQPKVSLFNFFKLADGGPPQDAKVQEVVSIIVFSRMTE